MKNVAYALLCALSLGSGLELSVAPGKNLWIGEDLMLSCLVPNTEDHVAWHRSTQTGEEILSHGSNLLIQDDRFELKVIKYEDSRMYQIKITGVLEADSGRYACDNTQGGLEGSSIEIGVFIPYTHQAREQVLSLKYSKQEQSTTRTAGEGRKEEMQGAPGPLNIDRTPESVQGQQRGPDSADSVSTSEQEREGNSANSLNCKYHSLCSLVVLLCILLG